MTDIEQISAKVKTGKQPKILVVGDIMADRYVWGTASRISPEAPVPVLMAGKETVTLGGAGNVAQNLRKLNAKVMIGGVLGKDPMAAVIREQLRAEQVDAGAIIEDPSRSTTLKTRIMAGNHQLLRVDRETREDIGADIEKKLLIKLESKVKQADIVMLSDYNKGVLTRSLTQKLIRFCKKENKKVLVDPKGLHYQKYTGAWLIKPNRRELADATVTEKVHTKKEVVQAARKLLAKTKSEYLVVTLSEEGLALVSGQSYQNFPVKAREVFDVTGAGDTVFASLGYFLALGADITTACELANYAAAIAVSKVGSVAVRFEEILSIINRS